MDVSFEPLSCLKYFYCACPALYCSYKSMKLAPLKKPLIMLIPLNTAIWLVFGSLFAGVALVISFVTVAVILSLIHI